MRPLVHLGVGRLETDWGRWNMRVEPDALFQTQDLQEVPHLAVDRLEAAQGHDGEIVESGEGHRWPLLATPGLGYSKPLVEVVDHIELLGHTDA